MVQGHFPHAYAARPFGLFIKSHETVNLERIYYKTLEPRGLQPVETITAFSSGKIFKYTFDQSRT